MQPLESVGVTNTTRREKPEPKRRSNVVVSATHQGRSAKSVRNTKPTTFGQFADEWWCESQFGDTVLVVACKTPETAAEEAADYFNALAVDGPLDTIEIHVESWEGMERLYSVHRVTRWNVLRLGSDSP